MECATGFVVRAVGEGGHGEVERDWDCWDCWEGVGENYRP